ncbi:MAG: hypothetical protein JWP06_4 [Candidatus Saccharibacteria bacterium]|nr:hypothetical protein [Candidatus Saccharibacteria bacterium]
MILSKKLRHISPKRRRTLTITAISGLFVVLVAVYTFWSMNTWSSYKTTYESWQKELQVSVDAAMALPGTTSAERAKKLTAFKNVSGTITSAQQSLCHTPVIIAWQHVIVGLRQHEEACAQTISKADTFGKKMQMTTSYLESEQTVAMTIEKTLAASQDKVTEATWNSQVTTWQDADKAIGKMSSGATFAPVKASALEKVKVLESTWQELLAAHAAKDKTKYTEAQSNLTIAYAALGSLSTVSAGQLAPLTTALQSAYAQLFSLKT